MEIELKDPEIHLVDPLEPDNRPGFERAMDFFREGLGQFAEGYDDKGRKYGPSIDLNVGMNRNEMFQFIELLKNEADDIFVHDKGVATPNSDKLLVNVSRDPQTTVLKITISYPHNLPDSDSGKTFYVFSPEKFKQYPDMGETYDEARERLIAQRGEAANDVTEDAQLEALDRIFVLVRNQMADAYKNSKARDYDRKALSALLLEYGQFAHFAEKISHRPTESDERDNNYDPDKR